MEDKIPPHGQEVDECETTELRLYWNKCLDSERFDSVELNPVIRQQIQQNGDPWDAEKSLHLPKQQLVNQSTLSHNRLLLEAKKANNVSREEYEHRIQILENQKEELMKVNKQWDRHFRYMKQTYENKVSELNRTLLYQQSGKDHVQEQEKVVTDQEKGQNQWQPSNEEFNLELLSIKEENSILKKQNHVLRNRSDCHESEIKRLNKILLQVSATYKVDSIDTRLDPSLQATTYEDLKTNNEVLIQQVKIYEEDFIKERADKEKIRKEKLELQKSIQKLKLQLQMNKPDYQWYVPGRLPPDVKQKDTGPSLK